MGSVTKLERLDRATGRKVVVHRAYVRRAGVSKSKVFPTRTEAKAWLREHEAPAALSRASRAASGSFAALVEAFAVEPPARGRKSWAPEHLAFWKDSLGALSVGKVDRAAINTAVATLRTRPARRGGFGGVQDTGATLSAASVNRYLASLSAVFNFAMERGIVDEHPMKGGKVRRMTETGGRQRILSADEETRLMDAAKASTWPMLHLFLRMALTTAARRSELLGLRWRDVHLDERVAILPTSKNGRPRALPLVDDVRVALEAASKVRPIGSEYVFFDPRNPKRPKPIAAVWKACRARAGLLNDRDDPLERVVLHSTRHTAVTRLLRGGANLAQAAAVSGHQTLAMLKRYEHLAASDAVDLAQRLLAGGSK